MRRVLIVLSILFCNFFATAQKIPITTEFWEGNWWSYNINNGSWFPTLIGDTTRFGIDNYSQGEIRTIQNFKGTTSIKIKFIPYLTTVGVNGDGMRIGFTNQWSEYFDQFPTTDDSFIGLWFNEGNIYFRDQIESNQFTSLSPVATYSIGELTELTLIYSPTGTIKVTGTGILDTIEYSGTVSLNSYKFTISDGNSEVGKGFDVLDVSKIRFLDSRGVDTTAFSYGGKFNGNYYYISKDYDTWTHSKNSCELNGGHLATITSQSENDFIKELTQSENYLTPFLGATDSENEGTWNWINGEPLIYTNWQSGEPNNQGIENVLAFRNDSGEWWDRSGNEFDKGLCLLEIEGKNELVAYYPFNNNTLDESGNGNHGTNIGATPTSDRFGNENSAFSFDGLSNLINVPNSESLKITGDISVIVWVKTEIQNNNKSIVEKYYGTYPDHGWLIETYPDGTALFEGRDGRGGSTIQSGSSGNFSDNKWHQLIGVRNGNLWKIFLDGKMTNMVDVGGTSGEIESLGNIRIGASDGTTENGSVMQFFNGSLDDIRIYNYALSQNQIDSLYHLNGWDEKKLVAYYPFNNNTLDESGNGNHGTNNGATPTSDRFGNENSAMSFNGSTNYISVAFSSSLLIHDDISVVAWVKNSNPISEPGRGIVEKYYNGLNDHGWILNSDPSGPANFQGRDGRGSVSTLESNLSDPFDDGGWHLLVGQREGNDWKIYLDGKISSHTDYGGSAGSIETYSDLRIGAVLASPTNFWNGEIDDISIYNYAISQNQIDSLYHLHGWDEKKLVAYYPFNNNTLDESGNGNHGINHGAIPTSDRFGNENSAYSFDGNNGYIEVANSSSLNPQTISFSIWVNYLGGSGNPRIFSKWQIEVGDSYQLFQQNTGNIGAMASFIKQSEPQNFIFSPSFQTNQWDYFVIERDLDSVRIYKNSQLVLSEFLQGSLETNSGNLVFGVNGGTIGTGQDYFSGSLDDIKIYNYALSQNEIDNLYHLGGWDEATVPVELNSFSIEVNQIRVNLSWQTATETNNYGFEIEKSADKQIWKKIGFIAGKGTTTETQSYSFSDPICSTHGFYRLKQIDHDGKTEFSEILEFSSIPEKYALSQNYPNPFNPETTISFDLPVNSEVEVSVFNLLGAKVGTVVQEPLPAGHHEFSFNASGLASGVYFYQMKAGKFVQTRKLTVLK